MMFADTGNLTFNVEYDGIRLTASPQANASECYNSCKNSQGTHLRQTAISVYTPCGRVIKESKLKCLACFSSTGMPTRWFSPGNPGCNVFVYCAADSSVGCPASQNPGSCQLRFQPGLDTANPSVITDNTNLASGE